ncbi:MAG TPA: MBL fold metallo-hydrolase [Rectinema sp.]|nr:MBL fold metallo-hydrolase [Rectinema sp.]HRR38848.1 MBL fold metallo-hydrolase [Rectinema sp.]HRT39482.1 MBL fold metallo-hydrolase [Rectinema sp.]
MAGVQLRLIGHMTVLIEMDGFTILTDPWFGPRGRKERALAPRIVPPAASLGELGHIDLLLVSHNHIDHCDDISLETARDQGFAIVGPRSVAKRAKKLGAKSVVELEPGMVHRINKRSGDRTINGSADGSIEVSSQVSIEALKAEHPLSSDALAYLIRGSKTVFFSGDTRYTPELECALKSAQPDVALVQAACAHYPLLGDDGMSLPEAAALVRAIRPRWTVPVHLHCAGKWLNRSRGIRIRRDNQIEVSAALKAWKAELESEGLGICILGPGEECKLFEE